MQTTAAPQERFVGAPFYIFITVLLGSAAIVTAVLTWQAGNIALAALALLIGAAHLGVYWLNLRLHTDRRWRFFYYPAQSALIVTLALLPYGADVNGTLAAMLCITQVGEALGLWGNTRRALWLGLYYSALLVLLLTRSLEGRDLLAALGSILVNGGFIVAVMMLFNQQLAEQQKAEELAATLEAANAQLAAYAARNAALTLQAERQRMARELHDTLAQGVAGLVLQLEAVKAHLAAGRSDRAAAIVEQALGRARGTLADSRAAIDDLRTMAVTLDEAACERVARFTQATGIPCDLKVVAEDVAALPTEVSTHALHVLSEALTNTARHAQATQVWAWLVVEQGRLELEVCDDGLGFDAAQPLAPGHYGLLGMRERARLCHGALTVTSAPGQGTCIRFVAPGSERI
jgi:NarL family two-component system sensor histidine kinase YdfH